MAFTHQGDGYDSTWAVTTYNKTITGTLTGGGVLWVVTSNQGTSIGVAAALPTVTMTGATFTLVRSVEFQSGGFGRRLSVHYSQDYDPGASQTLTVTTTTPSSGQLIWTVEEETDGVTSGSPITQSADQADTTADLTTSVALSAGTGRLFTATWLSNNETHALTGATNLVQRSAGGPAGSVSTFWSATMQTNPTVTWPSLNSSSLMIALEAPGVASTQAEIAWAQLVIPAALTEPTVVTPATVNGVHTVPTPTPGVSAVRTPATVAATFTVPTPVPLIVGTGLATPNSVDAVFTVPTPQLVAAMTITPATVPVVFTVDTPGAGYLLVRITARLDAMFYRQVDTTELALVPLGNTQPLGFRRSESWEKVSSRFVMNQGTHDLVMGLMTSVWPAQSLAPRATLTTSINAVLRANGYRAPGGFELV